MPIYGSNFFHFEIEPKFGRIIFLCQEPPWIYLQKNSSNTFRRGLFLFPRMRRRPSCRGGAVGQC